MSAIATAEEADLHARLEQHRPELTGYCYRMLGSAHEAEDAVQDTFIRAWRGYGRFEGRAALRGWLYRIATNVCLDMLRGRNRRALPMDLVPAAHGRVHIGAPLPEQTWIEPIPDRLVMAVTPPGGASDRDPAEVAASRESIRLAFVAALQHLLPRQRAVLILRDVLRWKAAEVADLLGTSAGAVNSILRRARATVTAANLDAAALAESGATDPELLARYVDAFERFDIEALVALLHDDATISMPPHALWLRGRDAIRRWLSGVGDCRHSRMLPVLANGSPAVAVYRPTSSGGRLEPFAIHVLEVSGGQITAIHAFLDPSVFGLFRLPPDPA